MLLNKLKIISFFVLLSLLVSDSNASRAFSSCCSMGQSKYSPSNPSSCSDYSSLTDKSSSCKYAFTICCSQSRRNSECERGKKQALATLPCSDLNSDLAECCNCCELGIESAKSGESNSAPEISGECKKVFTECFNQHSKSNDCSPRSCENNQKQEENDCSSHRCPSNQQCENSRNGPVCKCSSGFEKDQRTNQCVSVQVKVEGCKGSNSCNLPCPKGYQCKQSCSFGFSFDAIFGKCRDVNECSSGNHNCGSDSKCENLQGSFTCIKISSCGAGFKLNKNTQQCEDVDECESKKNTCGAKEACVNTKGDFKCIKIECPKGYNIAGEGQNSRCDKAPTSCKSNEPECQKKPVKIFYSYTSISYNTQVPIRIFTTRVNINTRSQLKYEFKLTNSQGVSLREDQFMVKQTDSNTFDVFLLEQCKSSDNFQFELKIEFNTNSQYTCILNKIQVFVTE